MKKIAIFLFVFVFSGGIMVGGANAAAPGSLLYGVDLAVEHTRLALATSPERTVSLQLSYAAERLQEAQALLAKGDANHADQAMVLFNEILAVLPSNAALAQGMQALQVSDSLDQAFDEDGDDDLSAYCQDGALTPDAPVHKVGMRLAEAYFESETLEAGYAEIMGWFCQGFGFGEIKLAYAAAERTADLDETFTPADLFEMHRDQNMGWGEIWQMIGLVAPPHKVDKNKGEDPVEEPGISEDPGEMEESKEAKGVCDSEAYQPHAQDLVEQFEGAVYEDIIGYFCAGYGFGEIKLAYIIDRDTEWTLDQIFAAREDGAGWGEIMELSGLKEKEAPSESPSLDKPENDPQGPPENLPNNDKDKEKDKK